MNRIIPLFLALFCTFAACSSANVESARIVQEGIKQYEAKQYDKALVTFKNAVTRDPNNDKAYIYMAKIEANYRNYDGAVQYLEMAAGIYDDPQYWCEMGNAHYAQGRELLQAGQTNEAARVFGKCVTEMKRALENDPNFAEASLGLARCYEGMDQFDEAAKAYSKSIRSNPKLRINGVTAHYQELGALYLRFGFFDEAEAVLNNGLLNNLEDGQLETTLADALYDMGQFDKALAHYETAITSLERMAMPQATQLSAIYGAGKAALALARSVEKETPANAKPHYDKARQHFSRFADLALSDSESIRRADAVERMREIDAGLEKIAL